MKKAKNDGKALERAVRLIQETLIRGMPGMKGGEYRIEANKRITIEGERMEFDVYAVLHPETDYQSVVVFECKDWSKPVGAGEIGNFGRKVNRIGATKGILVAKELTSDAHAALRAEPRLVFKQCTDTHLLKFEFVHTVHECVSARAQLVPSDPSATFPSDTSTQRIRIGNRTVPLQQFGAEEFEAIAQEDKKHPNARYHQQSVHWIERGIHWEFSRGECDVAGIGVAQLKLEYAAFVYVESHSPAYQCTIDGDGQLVSYQLQDTDFPGGKLDISVVVTTRKLAPPKSDKRTGTDYEHG